MSRCRVPALSSVASGVASPLSRTPTAWPSWPLFRAGLCVIGVGAALAASPRAEAGACSHARRGDPLKVHLLTTSPGALIFNSMGHTAISISGGPLKEAEVYNWGAFNGQTQSVLSEFLTGRMEFWLAAEVWKVQWKRTVRQDRTMVAQELNLPQARAAELLDILQEEHKPENRYYVYHYAHDNCATRARDVLDRVTAGALQQALEVPAETTGRFEGSRHLAQWPVVAFGFHFLASSFLDQPLTEWTAGMVPERLMKSLSKVEATEGWPDGRPRPLVAETCTLRKGTNHWAREAPLPRWPPALAGLVLAVAGGALAVGGGRGRRVAGGVLLGLPLLLGGILGTVTLALWANSDLDGVGPTENWAFTGLQSFVVFGLLVRALRDRAGARARATSAVLAGVGLAYPAVKLALGLPQDNWDMVGTFLPALVAAAVVVWARRR